MQNAHADSAASTKPSDCRRRDDHHADLPPEWRRLLSLEYQSEPAPQIPKPNSDTESTLGFFLDFCHEKGQLAELEAAPVLLARNPDGALEQAEAIDSEQVLEGRLTPHENSLLQAVLALPQSNRKGRTYARIAGTDGDELLARMLSEASCFLGGIAGFWLRHGEPRSAKWVWQINPDGSQQAQPQLPAGQHALKVGQLWYVDPESSELGRLDGPLARAGLIDAPALEPEQAQHLSEALADSALGGLLAAPTVFAEPKVLDRVPAPCLTLHALTRHARLAAGMPPLAYVRLAFDYGGVRLTGLESDPEVRRVRGNRLLTIKRHRAEELSALERLEAQGLVPAVDCEGLPWELTEILPEDAWLFPGTGYTGALEVNTPARWLSMRARLEPEGFAIEYAPSFPFEVLDDDPHWYVRATPDRRQRSYTLEIGLQLDDKRVDLLPAVGAALTDGQFDLVAPDNEPADACWHAPLDDRRRIPVALAELRALLKPIAEYLDQPGKTLRLPWGQAGRLEELAAAMPKGGVIDAPARLKGLAGRLRDAAGKAEARVPDGFVGTLRHYQLEGLRWLNALASAGLGGVLADDMGLGKTVQLLVHVLSLKQGGALQHPVLVVAPTSLLPNWESEIKRYTPGLSCLTVHGPQRAAELEKLEDHDLVLTSYALLPRDLKVYKRHKYALLVLDEAQQVKNPRTQARRAACALRAERRVCLTGTPLENHLGELWSQLDLAVPGLLGDERSFRTQYRIPIEKQADTDRQARLNRRIAPFILRRSKSGVARELPPKTEMTRSVILEGSQRRLYDSLRASLFEELREVIAERGIEHSGIMVLDALLKLRQVCCDPRLVKHDSARKIRQSAKFELLMTMLPELLAEGRRILLFSQFTEMLGLIAAELDKRKIRYTTLTGETRDRAAPVQEFQQGDTPLFLLSLKAGGVGLNLTAADTVIHYDPWWNPAAEAQASDRAHRIGQDKPVFVYRLICADTVEQRIEALKARKAELADAILSGGGTRDRLSFSEEDLDTLFAEH